MLWIWLMGTAALLALGLALATSRRPPARAGRQPLPSPGVLEGERVFEAIERACRETGLIRPPHARWIARVVLESGTTVDVIARRVLAEGRRMSAEDRSRAGLAHALQVGDLGLSALEESARADPLGAITVVLERALGEVNRQQDLVELRRRRVQEVVVVPGRSACEQVQALAGRNFPIDDPPALPVESCDSPCCLCEYRGLDNRGD